MSSSTSSSEPLAIARPAYALNRDVDEGREPLVPLQLPYPNTNHNPNCAGSKISPSLEPSHECFSTFVNDEELATFSKVVILVNTAREDQEHKTDTRVIEIGYI
jgi:hypothetical protein